MVRLIAQREHLLISPAINDGRTIPDFKRAEIWPVRVVMSYVYDRGTSGLASQFCGYGCKPEEKHLLHRFPSPAKDVT